MKSAAKTFGILGNEITLELFKHFTGQGKKPYTTPKQYYSRLMELRKAGIIVRMKDSPNHYAITSFGTVIKYIIEIMERAIQSQSQLSILDAAQLAKRRTEIIDVTDQQWQQFIEDLVKDTMVRNIIFPDRELMN